MEATIHKAYVSLHRTNDQYKRDFDRRVRRINERLKPRTYVYLNPIDGAKTTNWLASPVVGQYRVLANNQRTIKIDRDGVMESDPTDS